MAEINWTNESLRWLEDIFDFIAQNNPGAASQVVNSIYDRVQVLKDHREIGRQKQKGCQALPESGSKRTITLSEIG